MLLCSLSTAVLLAHADREVVRLTLDSNAVHRIAIAVDRVTTLVFPSDIAALEAAFISQQPDLTTRFALSFQPGARYFSVRALGSNASANLNIILGREIYAIELFESTQPVYVVEFVKPPLSRPATSLADPRAASSDAPAPRQPLSGAADLFTRPGSLSQTNAAGLAPTDGPPMAAPTGRQTRHTTVSPVPRLSAAPPSKPRGRQTYQTPSSRPPAPSTPSNASPPSVPKPSSQTVGAPLPASSTAASAPQPSAVRPTVTGINTSSTTHYQPASYRLDHTSSYPAYRSYTYSYLCRDNRWSYRRPAAGNHLGISVSIGSCPPTTFRRVPFP